MLYNTNQLNSFTLSIRPAQAVKTSRLSQGVNFKKLVMTSDFPQELLLAHPFLCSHVPQQQAQGWRKEAGQRNSSRRPVSIIVLPLLVQCRERLLTKDLHTSHSITLLCCTSCSLGTEVSFFCSLKVLSVLIVNISIWGHTKKEDTIRKEVPCAHTAPSGISA